MAATKPIKGEVAVDPVSIHCFQAPYTFWTRKNLPWSLRKHCFPSILTLPVIVFSIRIDLHQLLFFLCFTSVKGYSIKLCHSSCSASLKRKVTVHPTPTRLLSASALDHTDFSPSCPRTLWWTPCWANSPCWLGTKLFPCIFSFH